MKKFRTLGFAFFIALIYAILALVFDFSRISNVFGTVATITGLICLWLQLIQEQDLNEAKYIMEYNNTFISSKDLTSVETKLEDYLKGRNKDIRFYGDDRQLLINYLVHLEGLSSLVFHDVLPISKIDDIFAYRFFLATNNPIVQNLEIIPDAQYYRGIIKLYKYWKRYRVKKKLPMPMIESSLDLWIEFNNYAR